MADFLTTVDDSGYNYGTTPNVPVAEQNQTYFAYWNGIGGSRPEYMDGSSYFIKYLIDINGNVVNPEPYTETTNIDAVPLHNLKNNFEVGKRAVVRLVEPDPLQSTPTGANPFSGIHRIAHVGKIIPVLVTETGENKEDYITTMSFGPTSTQTTTTPGTPGIPPLTANFSQTSYNVTIPPGDSYINELDFSSNSIPSSNPSWTTTSNTPQILSSSVQTGTRIRLKFEFNGVAFFDPNSPNNLYVKLAVYKNNSEWMGIWNTGQSTPQNTSVQLNADGVFEFSETTVGIFTTQWSNYFDYNENDYFSIRIQRNTGTSYNSFITMTSYNLYFQQETPPSSGSGTTTVAIVSNVNEITSSYFVSAFNYPNSNGGYSVLTASPGLTSIYNLEQIQNIDPSSSLFGFAPTVVPFGSLKPGDFIRFEYRKQQTHTIFNINPTSSLSNENVLQFSITPALSTEISGPIDLNNFNIELNHFQIYRVLDDGLYVTLDVKPNWGPGGNAYTGLLIPEFISDELSEKLETLIQDLTQKEIIQ
jgi:hypothetical protein